MMIAAAAIGAASVACTAFLVLTGVAPPAQGGGIASKAGQYVGMALPLFALACIVAALAAGAGRLVRGKSVSVATPIWWGVLTTTVFTAFISIGIYAKREMDKVQYQPLAQDNSVVQDERFTEGFLRSFRQSCEEKQRQSPENRAFGVSEQQIAAYCDCTANHVAHSMTASELIEFFKTKVQPPSLEAKILEAAAVCTSKALGLQ